MKEHADIRWKQRFNNLVQAHALLEEALQTGSAGLNQLEKEGLTQRFEFTFELAWKTLKDYLEESGVQLTISTPREVIRVAFASGILADGTKWLEMLEHRNLLSHTYDVKRFDEAVHAIESDYSLLIRDVVAFFSTRILE